MATTKKSSPPVKNKIKFQYLLNEVEEKQDPESALKIVKMILDGEAKITIVSPNRLLFILNSKYEGKCIRCSEPYGYGDAIFCANKKAWHISCRTTEEESQTFFQTCLKKGLLEEIIEH